MKINQINLTNFGVHENLLLKLPNKKTLIWGLNAKGKSTIIDAISFALTGTSSKYVNQKDGIQELVTKGKTNSLVAININNDYEVTRTIPHTLNIKNQKGSLRTLEQKLEEDLNITKEKLLICIYASSFTKLDNNEKKDFLFKILNINITKDIFKEEFKEWAKMNQIDEILCNQVLEFLDKKTKYFEYDKIEVFNAINDFIKDENKGIKKDIKAIETYLTQLVKPEETNIPTDKLPEMLTLIEELKNKKNNLLIQLGSEDNKNQRIIELKQTIALKESIKKPEISISSLKDQLKIINEEILENTKKKAGLEVSIKEKDKLIDNLKKFNGKCSLFNDIACPMTEDNINLLIGLEAQNRLAFQEDLSKANEIIRQRSEKKEKIEFQITETEKYNTEIFNIEKAIKEYDELIKDSVDTGKIRNEIRILTERIEKGEILISKVKEFNTYEKNKEEAINKLKEAKLENQYYDIIIKATNPKGIMSNILYNNISKFDTICNEYLQLINSDYKIKFEIDTGLNIIVFNGRNDVNFQALSTSEKLRINLVLTATISKLIGLKLFIVDDLETLVGENRNNLFNFVNHFENDFDSIILIAATEHCNNLENWNMIQL